MVYGPLFLGFITVKFFNLCDNALNKIETFSPTKPCITAAIMAKNLCMLCSHSVYGVSCIVPGFVMHSFVSFLVWQPYH